VRPAHADAPLGKGKTFSSYQPAGVSPAGIRKILPIAFSFKSPQNNKASRSEAKVQPRADAVGTYLTGREQRARIYAKRESSKSQYRLWLDAV